MLLDTSSGIVLVYCIALLNDHWLLRRTSFEKCRLEFILMTVKLSAVGATTGLGGLHLRVEVVVKWLSSSHHKALRREVQGKCLKPLSRYHPLVFEVRL